MSRFQFHVVLFLCAAATLAGCGGDYAADGEKAFNRGNYREAVDLLEIALRDQEDSLVRLYLGISQNRMGRPREAHQTLLPLLPDSEYGRRAMRELVDVLVRLDLTDEAEQLVQSTLLQDSSDPVLLAALTGVQHARVNKLRADITKMLEAHVGRRNAVRASSSLGVLLTAGPGEFDKVFQDRFERLKSQYGFDDEARLRNLTEDANRRIRLFNQTLMRLRDADPTAHGARLELAKIANERKDAKTVEKVCREIIATLPDSIPDVEQRLLLARVRLEAVKLFRQSMQRSKRYDDAIDVLEAAAPTFPSQALFFDLGNLYYAAGRVDQLAALTGMWLKKDTGNVWAAYWRGYCLYRRGQFKDCVPYLDKAVGISPNMAAFNLMLGRALTKTDRAAQAVPCLQKARDLLPRDPDVVIELAQLYEAMGDAQRARDTLREAIRGPFRSRKVVGHARVRDALVVLYQKVGVAITSIRIAQDLHDADPDNPYIALRLAQFQADEGEFQAAARTVKRVQRTFPELPDAWRIGASLSLRSRGWSHVIKQVTKLNQLEPGDPTAPWLSAQAYAGQRRWEKARDAAIEAMKRDSKQVGATVILLDVEIAAKDWDRALTVGLSARKLFPKNPHVLERLASIHEQRGEWQLAIKTLAELQPLRPKDPAVALGLGRAFAGAKRPKPAALAFQEALKFIDPADRSARFEAARGLYRIRDWVPAGAALTALAKDLDPKDKEYAVTLAYLARCRHRLGDFVGATDAIIALRRTGNEDLGYSTLVAIAAEGRAWHEALEVYEITKKTSLDRWAWRAVLNAALAVGRWPQIPSMIDTLAKAPGMNPGEYLHQRGRAQLELGQGVRGVRSLATALENAKSPKARGELWLTQLRWLVEGGDAPGALAIIEDAALAAPRNVDIRYWGARAALVMGDLDLALDHLRQAMLIDATDEPTRIALMATLVARRSYQEALKVAATVKTQVGRRIRTLLGALVADTAPGGNTLATYLYHLRKKDFVKAALVAGRASDVPRTFQNALVALTAVLEQRPERAGLLADALARAEIMRTAGLLGDLAAEELRNESERDAKTSLYVALFRSRLEIGFDRGKAAAAAIVPWFRDGESKDPAVVYQTAAAALANTAASANVLIVVNERMGTGDLPPDLATDLATLLDEAGDQQSALLMALRASGDDRAVARAAVLAFDLRRFNQAAQLAAKLPGGYLARRPSLRFSIAYEAARKKHPDTAKLVGALLADSTALARLDPLRVAEIAIIANLESAIPGALDRALASAPYDPYLMNQLYLLLKSKESHPDLQYQLKLAVTLLDPRRKLRRVPRDQRPLANW